MIFKWFPISADTSGQRATTRSIKHSLSALGSWKMRFYVRNALHVCWKFFALAIELCWFAISIMANDILIGSFSHPSGACFHRMCAIFIEYNIFPLILDCSLAAIAEMVWFDRTYFTREVLLIFSFECASKQAGIAVTVTQYSLKMRSHANDSYTTYLLGKSHYSGYFVRRHLSSFPWLLRPRVQHR